MASSPTGWGSTAMARSGRAGRNTACSPGISSRPCTQSPYWKPQGLDRKLRFCLGAGYNGSVEQDGRVRGYGEEAMQTCPYATCLGHANYVGPKWETGDAGTRPIRRPRRAGHPAGLPCRPGREPDQDGQAREALAKSHHAYDIVAYEGGPSGYALPGRDSPEQKAINEKYGKSLAMAVASLDAWMRSYQYGWTYQNFLGYGQGLYWNSHTPLWDGFRPSPGWQALALRNRVAAGDLMAVEEKCPLLAGIRNSIRSSGPMPCAAATAGRCSSSPANSTASMTAPTSPTGRRPSPCGCPSWPKIILHKLTGDPRASNQASLAIAPQTVVIPVAALSAGVFKIDAAKRGRKQRPPARVDLRVRVRSRRSKFETWSME